MVSPEIGHSYGLKMGERYFRVTLMFIHESVTPPLAHVIVQEHSIDSFMNNTNARKRHKNRGEAVPCADIPLSELLDIG